MLITGSRLDGRCLTGASICHDWDLVVFSRELLAPWLNAQLHLTRALSEQVG